eukprot:jgi/Hompol1/821/HPOL_002434-RA
MSIYDKAAAIIGKLFKQQGTIKSLVMKEDPKDKKLLYAMVCESLKYREVIETIIQAAGPLKSADNKKIPQALSLVLVYDLLFGKGVKAAGKYKAAMLKHRTRLLSELAKIKVKRKCRSNEELIPAHIRNAVVLPRYVRVNTIKISVDAAIQHFVQLGYTLGSQEMLADKQDVPDQHLPELLLMPSNTDLHNDPLLLDGKIVLQDKASCFPAFILQPPQGSVVIDACAAPGNKTSHLAAIMNATGTIFAFDKSKPRLDTLIKLTQRAGCTNIQPLLESFLETDPHDPKYANVEYLLLDPSCSGSGIVGRMDHLLQDPSEEADESEESEDRIKALADFQKQVILHAFQFPSAKRVVYSTCSRHRVENEDVVEYVLKSNPNFKLVENPFPSWTRRGLPGSCPGAEHVIRAVPEEDRAIGFFVALFERIGSAPVPQTASVSRQPMSIEHPPSITNPKSSSSTKNQKTKSDSRTKSVHRPVLKSAASKAASIRKVNRNGSNTK